MTSDSFVTFMASAMGGFVVVLLMLWSLTWKGIALWKAAQRNSIPWFVVLLIFNTLGILEIIYIFLIAKEKGKCCN